MKLELALKDPLAMLEEQLDLVRSTALQIEKDFLQNGLELHLAENGSSSVAALLAQLEEAFGWLLERDEQRLLQLLYRIDLGEEVLRQAMRNHQDQPLAHLLAGMVLKREAQKVIIRHFYKTNQV